MSRDLTPQEARRKVATVAKPGREYTARSRRRLAHNTAMGSR